MPKSLILLAAVLAQSGICAPAREARKPDLAVVYVHGFCEYEQIPPFEAKLRAFFDRLSLNASVSTYRWDSRKMDFRKVVHQWTQSKLKASKAAKPFMENVIAKLETQQVPYFIVAYSLGSRVAMGALTHGGARLRYLRGIYLMGAALPHTFKVKEGSLPKELGIVNYYSRYLDTALKVSFYNAEGVKAGGEIGFDDTTVFENYRTVCTHVHKGGPIQRDYSSLAGPIGYLALLDQRIFVKGKGTGYNVPLPVGAGSVNWHDITRFERRQGALLIQQNANTRHYRAVAIDERDKRARKAWGTNLHSILAELQLFPGPYRRTVNERR